MSSDTKKKARAADSPRMKIALCVCMLLTTAVVVVSPVFVASDLTVCMTVCRHSQADGDSTVTVIYLTVHL